MKASHNNAAGRVGYVRAVFSERARGFAVPLDLLRVVCRVAGRVATRQRIGDAFKGYLVSESGQVAPMFAKSREKHAGRVDLIGVTGGGFSWSVGIGDAIDAPDLMPAGGMWRFDPEPFDYPVPAPMYAVRGAA